LVGENREEGSKPPPLPPRSTRPDYRPTTVATESAGTLSDTSSLVDTDENDDVSSTIAEADDEAELWAGMPEYNCDALEQLFDSLALTQDSPSVPVQDVNRITPSTPVRAQGTPPSTPVRTRVTSPNTPARALAQSHTKATPSKAPKQATRSSRLFSAPSTPVKAGKYNFYVVSKGSQVGVFDNW